MSERSSKGEASSFNFDLNLLAMSEPAPASPEQKPLLALPAPPPQDPDAPIKLDVGTSEPVSLYDKLGPTIVGSDGSELRPSNALPLFDYRTSSPTFLFRYSALEDWQLGRDG